ncbi:MAG: tyrosine--tRNA ligase [Planctomycetota bacterium JB042]
MGLYEELAWRGMIHDETEGVKDALAAGSVRAYIGFDPTADSLHVGSLVQLVTLRRLQAHGHVPVALVGGATGMIGDPSGKSKERNLLDDGALARNVDGIRAQISRFLDFEGANAALLVNNLDWLGPLTMIDFLRDVGKHFTVNNMLAKESVRRRVQSEQGISYTEFSYSILQAVDFLELYDRHGVTLQCGGSDQWGNIVAGSDFVRAKRRKKVHGLTVPLIKSASGEKFGKTEAGTVWLDAARTSPYDFFQFWLRTDDRDVGSYLRYFSSRGEEEIGRIEAEHASDPSKRGAQRALAEEMTALVHGEDALAQAVRTTAQLHGGGGALRVADLADGVVDRDAAAFEGEGAGLLDELLGCGLVPSKKEARRSIEGGGIYVNDEKVSDVQRRLRLDEASTDEDGVRYFALRKGKKSRRVLRITESR